MKKVNWIPEVKISIADGEGNYYGNVTAVTNKLLLNEDTDIDFEISVLKDDNEHGKKSYGWADETKLILFSSNDCGLSTTSPKKDLEWMIKVAETTVAALNKQRL